MKIFRIKNALKPVSLVFLALLFVMLLNNSGMAVTLAELNESLEDWWDAYSSTDPYIQHEALGDVIDEFYTVSEGTGHPVLYDIVIASPDYFEDVILDIMDSGSGLDTLCRCEMLSFIFALDMSEAGDIIDTNMGTGYAMSVRIKAASLRTAENWSVAKDILLDNVVLSPLDAVTWSAIEPDIENMIDTCEAWDRFRAAQYYDYRDGISSELLSVAKDLMDSTGTGLGTAMSQIESIKVLLQWNNTLKTNYISKGYFCNDFAVQISAVRALALLYFDEENQAAEDTLIAWAGRSDNIRVRDAASGSLEDWGVERGPHRDPGDSAYEPYLAAYNLTKWNNDSQGNINRAGYPRWIRNCLGDVSNNDEYNLLRCIGWHGYQFPSIMMSALLNDSGVRMCRAEDNDCEVDHHQWTAENDSYWWLKDHGIGWPGGDFHHRFYYTNTAPHYYNGNVLLQALFASENASILYDSNEIANQNVLTQGWFTDVAEDLNTGVIIYMESSRVNQLSIAGYFMVTWGAEKDGDPAVDNEGNRWFHCVGFETSAMYSGTFAAIWNHMNAGNRSCTRYVVLSVNDSPN